MTDRAHDSIDEDDVALLLPWYATGTLDEHERRRVERFLAEHPEQRAHLRAVEEELEGTVALNRALPGPSPASLDAILATVRSESRATVRAPAARTAPQDGFLSRTLGALGSWLDARSPPVRGAAIAALMLLAVAQAGVIGTLVAPTAQDEPAFEVATGDAVAPAARTDILVTFAPDASLAEVSALLRAIDARVVDGPRASGVWGLALSDAAAGEEAVAEAIRTLEGRRDLVLFAAPGDRP